MSDKYIISELAINAIIKKIYDLETDDWAEHTVSGKDRPELQPLHEFVDEFDLEDVDGWLMRNA